MFLSLIFTAALWAQNTLALIPPVGHGPSGPIFPAPPGSRVQQSGKDMKVIAKNGTVIHVFKNVVSSPSRRQETTATQASLTVDSTEILSSINASIVVPPPPKTFESQIIFFGAGLQVLDDSGSLTAYLQPALQYGASNIQGGSFWTAAILLELPLEGGYIQVYDNEANPQVNVGDRLELWAGIDADPPPFPGHWYHAFFTNRRDILALSVGFSGSPWRAAVSIEQQGISQTSDYPKGSLAFENINVETTTGFSTGSWTEEGAGDVSITIDKDGSRDSQVSLVFPPSS
ncbi:hypothetical protein MIND_01200600 [Mycena indigotica]|uniref:Uncharacterized protein n=1 Tax=Mycena indigotica TaxID=2126181 RepID=A0A8H6VWS6_9AGAR|nr:uncharacterized protein MIND_01200600 [Mycena indigotica]KAF7293013.1 hypothetical protein MIND_01200600 [Mycena indigotica]